MKKLLYILTFIMLCTGTLVHAMDEDRIARQVAFALLAHADKKQSNYHDRKHGQLQRSRLDRNRSTLQQNEEKPKSNFSVKTVFDAVQGSQYVELKKPASVAKQFVGFIRMGKLQEAMNSFIKLTQTKDAEEMEALLNKALFTAIAACNARKYDNVDAMRFVLGHLTRDSIFEAEYFYLTTYESEPGDPILQLFREVLMQE